jgi:pimeloyl-ACP methyl ester carboxylesterase
MSALITLITPADGGDSDYMTPERVLRTRELFSAAEFQEIAGAGHIVHLDKPEHFYSTLRNFLERRGAR